MELSSHKGTKAQRIHTLTRLGAAELTSYQRGERNYFERRGETTVEKDISNKRGKWFFQRRVISNIIRRSDHFKGGLCHYGFTVYQLN